MPPVPRKPDVSVRKVSFSAPERVVLPSEVRTKALELQSILCAVKAGIRDPETDDDITWKSCADMCIAEATIIVKWEPVDAEAFYPNIKAALHLVYPDKLDTWFRKKRLAGPLTA